MKKSCIFVLILLSLYSCGSYTLQTNKGYEIKSILAITKAGDTISVPYKDFINDRNNNNNVRFNYNNGLYWNNWNYPYNWGWNSYWWNNNHRYWNNGYRRYNVPIKPKVYPKPKPATPRIRINQGRRNETINTNPRETRPTQTGSNGRRGGDRQVVPTRPTRPRISPPSQPRQIRRGSGQPRIQQTQPRGSSGQQGSGGTRKRQN